jgi:hypothetical protein
LAPDRGRRDLGRDRRDVAEARVRTPDRKWIL